MEEGSKEPEEKSCEKKDEVKDDEESLNLSNLDNIERILEEDAENKLKFLEFERQMFLDSVFNDGLVICAK